MSLNNTLEQAREAHLAGDNRRAFMLCRGVLKRSPNEKNALRLIALASIGAGRHALALEYCRATLKEYPNDPVTLANMAGIYHQQGDDATAKTCIERAARLAPDNPGVLYTRGLCRLKHGDFENGLPDYEHRFQAGTNYLCDPELQWRGEDLGGLPLTIWSDQGNGDLVQMARYFKKAKEKANAGELVIGAHSNMYRLMQCVDGVEKVTNEISGLHVPAWSLPLILGERLETVDGKPYLNVPKQKSRRFTVGLCWEGSQETLELRDRSLHPKYLRPIHELQTGILCKSLQYGEGGFTPGDFYDTSRAVGACDLVITVDTSVAHIAGAMGVPCWTMLRYQGDFRWFRERSDSPWYDSMTLYRQPKLGDWGSVVEGVVKDLKEKTWQHQQQ